MEGLKKRVLIFGGIMLAAGVFNLFTYATAERPMRSEKWMESIAPAKVNDMTFLPSEENPAQSYRMNKQTYDMLAPFGIVARVYSGSSKSFDVVVIASESRASFHDPRICFSGQDWVIADQDEIKVETRTRGTVPVMLVKMDRGNLKSQMAAFTYRGPSGFHAKTTSVKLDMFWQRLLNKPDVEGVFYRFIPQNPDCTLDELKQFIGDYLDAAKESSQGYF